MIAMVATAVTNPLRATRKPPKAAGAFLIVRIRRDPPHSTATAMGIATHFNCQAATSPALTIVENRSTAPLPTIHAAITEPRYAASMTNPAADAVIAGPYETSWCSGLANGGPTARAPQDGQPLQSSTSILEPQAGQMINLVTSKNKCAE